MAEELTIPLNLSDGEIGTVLNCLRQAARSEGTKRARERRLLTIREKIAGQREKAKKPNRLISPSGVTRPRPGLT